MPRKRKAASPRPRKAVAATPAAGIGHNGEPARKTPPSQPAANAVRGEHELAIGGVTYRMRPSRTAINAIEAKTGLSMLELAQLGNTGALKLAQLGVIAAALIHAGADDDMTKMITAERFEELVYETGVTKPMIRITLCLLDAANGGRTASGNAKAAAE